MLEDPFIQRNSFTTYLQKNCNLSKEEFLVALNNFYEETEVKNYFIRNCITFPKSNAERIRHSFIKNIHDKGWYMSIIFNKAIELGLDITTIKDREVLFKNDVYLMVKSDKNFKVSNTNGFQFLIFELRNMELYKKFYLKDQKLSETFKNIVSNIAQDDFFAFFEYLKKRNYVLPNGQENYKAMYDLIVPIVEKECILKNENMVENSRKNKIKVL